MTTDEKIDAIYEMVIELVKGNRSAAARAASTAPASQPATDADLDGKYGNPEVRKDPPMWIKDGGASYQGRKFSECPADYLDALAKFCDWKAGKDDEKGTDDGAKYAKFARLDASRARGWALRVRAGWKSKPPASEFGDADDGGELPF